MKVWQQKPIPYIYSIEKHGQLMIYYGANHSFDPNHKQWEDIRKHFNQFLEKTTGKDCVVLVEGGGNQLRTSEEIAIKQGGEPLFTTFIAHKAGITAISPEPDELYEINELLKIFSKDEIMYYYFSRLVHQWQRYSPPRPDFINYLGNFMKHYLKLTGWKEFEFTIDNMKKIHRQFTDKSFDETSEEQFYHMIWPNDKYPWVSNKVAMKSSKLRNDHIASEIKRYWDQGKNVFVVFGQGHAVEQEAFLRENLK